MRIEPWNKNTQVSVLVKHVQVLIADHCSDCTLHTVAILAINILWHYQPGVEKTVAQRLCLPE